MLDAILTGGLVGVIILTTAAAIRLSMIIKRYTYQNLPIHIDTLPTVSVCIPARNETHAMTTCLERVLASNYDRLEVIVLDDSSVDDTSVLIKSFAHEGVRFVEGSALPAGWLGKNHAWQGLLEEASGTLLLYLDVDTVIHPDTVSRLVAEMIRQQASIMSVMPQRQDGMRLSVFFGALRYFWPLFLSNSYTALPTSGSCLLIDRKKLLELGGFHNTEASIEPEVEIVHRFNKAKEIVGYSISTTALGVGFEKRWHSQLETSIRLLKPVLGSSFASLIIATALFAVVVLPFLGIISWVISDVPTVGLLSLVALLTTTLAVLIYYRAAWSRGWLFSVILWPYILFQECVLIVLSVLSYAGGQVTWKGRPIKAK